MVEHFNTAAYAKATEALNLSWVHLCRAPDGFFRTLALNYMEALDGFRSPASLESEEFKTIDHMINHLTSPDMYSGIRQLEPQALEGLMALKTAAGKLRQAANPPQGVYDAPALTLVS